MTQLDEWVAAVCDELDLDGEVVPTALILDLARDVARGVLRPGAPVSTYLLGLAVGRGADPSDASARLSALVTQFPTATDDDATP